MQEIVTLILKIILAFFAILGIKDTGSKIFFNLKGRTNVQKSISTSESVYGDKITNNYISLPGIGNKDDLFATEKTQPKEIIKYVERNFYEDGLNEIGFSNEKIEYLGNIFNIIFNENGSSKNGVTLFKGAIFSIGVKNNNLEWREHCAGSLRELFDEFKGGPRISSAFCLAFKSKYKKFPKYKDSQNEYNNFSGFYDYFSEIHHHNSTFILQRLRILYGSDIKVGDDTPDMFLKVVIDYLSQLDNFFNKHLK